jgi:hypothetical protein
MGNALRYDFYAVKNLSSPGRRRLVWAGQCVLVALSASISGYGHDAITTKVTFDREIVRLMISHCGSCHQDGGSAFSLMTYDAARPWAKAIGEEVLQRRMPPWGAVKGFGDFRNDKGLTEEQLELIVDWEEGGAPEGDPKDIPTTIKFPEDTAAPHVAKEVSVSGDTKLSQAIRLDGIAPKTVPDGATWQVTAELPDGSIEPLIWFQSYRQQFKHPYLLRRELTLPAGTVIRGVPAGSTIALLPKQGVKPDALVGKLVQPTKP